MDTEIKSCLSWVIGKAAICLRDVCRKIGDNVQIVFIDADGELVQPEALDPTKLYETTLVFKDRETMDKCIKRLEQFLKETSP